ncbi:cell division topological specificity factor MinE [Rhizosaccharibacter radicis]|uniref:Cell division topological specificity factor n=1 Tax=Rhizosaccharibacter radicis TaxID=2782605 RepID=A0ABT1VVE7_9PROT|nr:cell division topological specificity factor MinE [Acetobacteraceae bacterium KSS12]
MSLLASLFSRRGSAPVARDRLQILLAHERAAGEGQSDLLAKLHEEILAVIAKHVAVDRDKVQIKLDRGAAVSTLEIDIEVPGLKSDKNGAPSSASARNAAGATPAAAKPAGTSTDDKDKPAIVRN